ncbi:MAG: hypothetical protein ACYDB1_00625 [Acidiferrobacteraceae bacterium]
MIRQFGITPVTMGERLERFAAPRRIAWLLTLVLACAAGVWFAMVVFGLLKLMGAI